MNCFSLYGILQRVSMCNLRGGGEISEAWRVRWKRGVRRQRSARRRGSNPSISADGEDLFVLQSSVGLAGSNDPVVLGTTGTSKSRIAYYMKTLSMKLYPDMTSPFVRKCFAIWNWPSNNPAKDGVFNMAIDYGNGITARKNMVLSQLIQQSSIGAVSTVELSFLEADEDVQ